MVKLPMPGTLTIEDVPNDRGQKLVVRWPAAEGESKDFEYEVQIAPTKDGPWHSVKRVFSNVALAQDLTIEYGRSAKGFAGHAVIAEPLGFYPPQDFLLATVGSADIAAAQAKLEAAGEDPRAVLASFDEQSAVWKEALAATPPAAEAAKRLTSFLPTDAPPEAKKPESEVAVRFMSAGGHTLSIAFSAMVVVAKAGIPADLGAAEDGGAGPVAPPAGGTGAPGEAGAPAALPQPLPGEVAALAGTLVRAMEAVVEAKRSRLERDLGKDTIEKARGIFAGRRVNVTSDLQGHLRSGYLGTDQRLAELVLERTWYAKLVVWGPGGARAEVAAVAEGRPTVNLFDWRKDNILVFAVVLGGLVLFFIGQARKNPDMYLRRIGGLDAVDEALGRATEMGKPVLFVHGLREMKEVSTIAAVNILGEIAKHVAKFDSKLLCANYDPIVLGVSQETVREGYTASGRPDAYTDDDVFLAGADQFSYVAAVDGLMLRQRPAANFYCGYFYAESLVLAETGALSGAIQIAATDSFTQLPFFVTTCDYTLMGEELYAASAYLSRDPLLLGSLKGQDYAKLLIMIVAVVGTVLVSIGQSWAKDLVHVWAN